MHKQKTRPIGRIANTKSNLTLSVRKGVVNKARPSFYVTIVKHGIENYLERAQPDFSEARTAREFLSPQPPFLPAPSERFAGAKRRRLGVLQEMISSRTVKIHKQKTHLSAFFYINNTPHRIGIYSIANRAKIRYTTPRNIRRKETVFPHLFLLIYYRITYAYLLAWHNSTQNTNKTTYR